jgi:uncharacterized membrane protein
VWVCSHCEAENNEPTDGTAAVCSVCDTSRASRVRVAAGEPSNRNAQSRAWLFLTLAILGVLAFIAMRACVLLNADSSKSHVGSGASICDQEAEFNRALAAGVSGLREYLKNCRTFNGNYVQRAKSQLELIVYGQADVCIKSSCDVDNCIALYSKEFSNFEKTQSLRNDADRARRSDRCVARLTFSLRVCNRTLYPASIAIAFQPMASPNQQTVKGWYAVKPNSCEKLDSFGRGVTYLMAIETDSLRGWRGSDAKFCVEIPGPFERVNPPGYNCLDKERLESFQKVVITTDEYTWTISGEPTDLLADTFLLAVCNTDHASAYVTTIGHEVGRSSGWTASGWYSVAAGECKDIGRFIKPYVYVWAFAQDGSGSWDGTDLERCVPTSKFVQSDNPNHACGPTDKVAHYYEVKSDTGKYTYTLR